MDVTNHLRGLSADRLALDRSGVRPREPSWRPVARFVIAAVVAVGVCRLVWSLVPRTLTARTGVVGYPIFANFAYQDMFWAWRLTVYGVPLLMITVYSSLAARGPLRRPHAAPRRRIRLVERPAPTRAEPTRAATVCRLGLPTLLVVVCAAARHGRYDWLAATAGLAYLFGVGAAAAVLTRWRRRWRPRPDPWWPTLALTNGIGGVAAAVAGLWFVSAHTWVSAAGVRYPMPWLPGWLALLAGAAALAWALWRSRRGLSTWDTERRLLVVVGAVALYLATSVLPGPLALFRGFDDATELAGSALLDHGLVPWRDTMFIHGVFPDILRGSASTAVFGDTGWALPAGLAMLFVPACWVFVYCLAAWASKANVWVLLTVSVLAVSGFAPTLETRFVAIPLSLIVLGVALKRRTRTWSAILVLTLLIQAVLVPETSFLAVPALACVVVADLVHHREPGASLWSALRMSRWCLVAGVAALAALAIGLVSLGALRGFVQYYEIFGDSHNLTGAIPPTNIGADETVQIAAGVVTLLLTAWLVTARVRRRGDWQPADWVTVVAAVFTALYGEKFLGHFDDQHVWQFATVELSLIALWVWQATTLATDAYSAWLARADTLGRPIRWSRRAPAVGAVATLVVLLVAVVANPAGLGAALWGADRRHQVSLADPISPVPRVGFVVSSSVVDPAMISDLRAVLRTYAGTDQPVFDMTNSPGYVDYLLGRRPATRFDPIVLAIPPQAQKLTIDDLKKSRPPLVLFDSSSIGVPVWDGIANNVRHYIVSEYVLGGYVPLLLTHGNLILLRRDLMKPGLTLPPLSQTPITSNLWYGRPCDWGYAPDFMPTAAHGASVRLPVTPLGQYRIESAWGWAVDPATGQGASSVLVTQGDRVVASFTPDHVRTDLPPSTTPTGFAFAQGLPDQTQPGFYVMSANGTAYPLRASPVPVVPTLQFPDGHTVLTSTTTAGRLEAEGSTVRSVGQVQVPAGTNLAGFPLATVESAAGPLANGAYEISNLIGDPHHSISFDARSDVASSLPVQVGACLQWHGFSASGPLYVEQAGGSPITSVVLSGVRN